jgi:putative ABC transport system permease protein
MVNNSYALATLWYERQRFLPAVMAVAFSALLIALQCGLLLGLFSITSIPIDESHADVWVSAPKVPSVDLGWTIPETWQSYLCLPEVERTEPYVEGFAYWHKPTGGQELCVVVGTRLGPEALGIIKQLTPEMRMQLAEPGTIVVDAGELHRLGIDKVGDRAEVSGKSVRVIGTVRGLRSLAGPYVFCSLETGRSLAILRAPPDHVTFLLAKCHRPQDAQRVVDYLNEHYAKKLTARTAEQFSLESRMHWLTKTKAGIALGLAALLGLLVGAVVTSQTLYSATIASLKEYAVLRALGIPRWRMALMVLDQSFWVGITGVLFALPPIYTIAHFGTEVGAKILLPWWLMAGTIGVTMVMALASGVLALRSLRQVEPATLLR